MQIVIDIPDSLGRRLEPFKERLPEVLDRGLRDLTLEQSDSVQDEQTIIEVLTSRPRPEQVLALKASPALQQHLSDLLARSKEGRLSHADERELDRILILEHLVRLAKVNAAKQLAAG